MADVAIVINCGVAGGSVETTDDQVGSVLSQFAENNEKVLAELESRSEAEKKALAQAAAAQTELEEKRADLFAKLQERAEDNEDLKLLSQLLGLLP